MVDLDMAHDAAAGFVGVDVERIEELADVVEWREGFAGRLAAVFLAVRNL